MPSIFVMFKLPVSHLVPDLMKNGVLLYPVTIYSKSMYLVLI